MRYYSDKLGGKIFNTEEELFKAEKAADKNKAEMCAERKKLVDEVEKCKKAADDAAKVLDEANKRLLSARNAVRRFDIDHQFTIVRKTLSDYDSIFDAISDIENHFRND